MATKPILTVALYQQSTHIDRLRKDVYAPQSEKLREFYHLKGYPRARIKLTNKKIDFEDNRVDITIDVHEGPHVNYVFKGAENISRKELRKRITLLQGGTIDELEIEASAQAMKEYLKNKGYPDAKITGTETNLKNEDILIVFDINEGKSRRISHVTFENAPKSSSKSLSNGMVNKRRTFGQPGTFYPEKIKSDDEAIITNLKKDGYLNAKIGRWKVIPSDDGYSLTIEIPINKGIQTKVERITFSGNKAFPDSRLLKALALRVGKPIDEPSLDNERRKLISFYADNGYPYAKIEQRWSANSETGNASITYTIDEGDLVHIGRILYLGGTSLPAKGLYVAQ